MKPFRLAKTPEIIFGEGGLSQLPDEAGKYGKRILFITGMSSFEKSGGKNILEKACTGKFEKIFFEQAPSEPSPELVDSLAAKYRSENLSVIAAVGGGSVIDCGKALSAMICENESIFSFLEGTGTKKPSGRKIPFIAVPTTSGTGSEATKNAVFTKTGTDGFKKSIRHDNYIPEIALVDPALTLALPRRETASSGIDALSQLIESYLSNSHNPVTDELALSGIRAAASALPELYHRQPDNIDLRSKMSYAALLSGITLANAGLIVIHGLAGTIGGYFSIPHGTICGTLLPSAMEMNLEKMKEANCQKSIERYAHIYEAMTGKREKNSLLTAEKLVSLLYELKSELDLPGLTEMLKSAGAGAAEIKDAFVKIAENSGIKNNPVDLSQRDMLKILHNCG